MTDVRVPTLGESVTEATVATWFKKPGDAVAVDEMLCELETDKVTVEVPAPAAGVMGEIVAAEGTTVGVDALLAVINAGNSASAAPTPAAPTVSTPSSAAVDVMVPALGRKLSLKRPFQLGSKRSAIPLLKTKCSANLKPTKSRSKYPHLQPAF